MTHLTLTLSNYLQSPIEGLLATIKSFVEAFKREQKIRATISELSQLSDGELRDIGISRGDIYSIALGDTDYVRGAK